MPINQLDEVKMKLSDKAMMIVEWSEEDGCYVGRCPALILGGVHGIDEVEVRRELSELVDEWLALLNQANHSTCNEATSRWY